MHDLLARRVIELLNEQRFVSPPVRQALAYIENNYFRPELAVSDVAGAAGVTAPHLASLFKEQLGQTVNRRINASKIASAKQLLQSELSPMTDIARRSGFTGLSVFSRKFRTVTGMSPNDFRKSVLKNGN